MSNRQHNLHSHFVSACDRFKQAHNLTQLATEIGMSADVLRNKFNPAQERHKLTATDLIDLYRATGDDTLFDGLLFDCHLTAVAITPANDTTPISHRVIDATAKVAGIGAQAVHVLESGRVTKGQRNALVGSLMATVEHLVLIATEVENKFQAVPGLACAADMARATLGA
ncbi:phage regulatory CII family protein [Aeromonas eucrenophila]|uniref:Phage regulatory CII family protein n=1 Tax=Aeromonas eucrenophila TaxID=649 RepID=A0ABW0Y9M4_9GAMM|nr:phage regulatory CII family protein [Aeromonas eucrenophila]